MARLRKDVKFEMDIFWASLAGQDPAKLLTALKGRVLRLHLKDIAKGAATAYTEADAPGGRSVRERPEEL